MNDCNTIQAQNETREEKDDDEMTDLQKELLEAAKKNKKRKHGFRTLTTKIGLNNPIYHYHHCHFLLLLVRLLFFGASVMISS